VDPKDYYGIKRRYVVRLVGRRIASLEVLNAVPLGYQRADSLWQLFPYIALELVLLIAGLFQRNLVNLYSRWRIVTIVLGCVMAGWFTWLTLGAPLRTEVGTPTAIVLSVVACLAAALLMFFMIIPLELAVRRVGPAKLATVIRLFDRRVASESCGLSIVRGTLLGLALLGLDTFLVWMVTNRFGISLDSFALIYIQGQLFLNNPWPNAQLVLYPVFQAMMISLLVSVVASLVTRVVRRSWIALFFAAAIAAGISTGPAFTIAAVQPYHWKVLVLLFDFLILSWAFTKFDVLTLFFATFTFAFCWQTYSLLVMFRQSGALDEWIAFAVWGLFVACAAAIAFKSSLVAAYRRVAMAFQ
jgi:hypothetical protein